MVGSPAEDTSLSCRVAVYLPYARGGERLRWGKPNLRADLKCFPAARHSPMKAVLRRLPCCEAGLHRQRASLSRAAPPVSSTGSGARRASPSFFPEQPPSLTWMCRDLPGDVAIPPGPPQSLWRCRDVRPFIAIFPDMTRNSQMRRNVAGCVAMSRDLSQSFRTCREVGGRDARSREAPRHLRLRRNVPRSVAKSGDASQCPGMRRNVPGGVAKFRKLARRLETSRQMRRTSVDWSAVP